MKLFEVICRVVNLLVGYSKHIKGYWNGTALCSFIGCVFGGAEFMDTPGTLVKYN